MISFTKREAVVKLFAILSGFEKVQVELFLRKVLKKRMKGVAEVIINEKDFAFIYKKKSSQLSISFNYGIWICAGFPLHD